MIGLLNKPLSNAELASPVLDGTTLRVMALNQGDASAILIRAAVQSDYLAPATMVKLRNEGDAIIPPGSKLLTFDVVPLLSEEESYAGSLEMLSLTVAKEEAPKTSIIFELAQSDGRASVLVFPLVTEDMFKLLRGNADRCSAIAEPNFVNGCIGTGMPLEDRYPQLQSNSLSK